MLLRKLVNGLGQDARLRNERARAKGEDEISRQAQSVRHARLAFRFMSRLWNIALIPSLPFAPCTCSLTARFCFSKLLPSIINCSILALSTFERRVSVTTMRRSSFTSSSLKFSSSSGATAGTAASAAAAAPSPLYARLAPRCLGAIADAAFAHCPSTL